MAFRQPLQQRRQIQRPASIPHSLVAHDATRHGRVDESQEWILFSPQLEHEPSLTSYTSQTSHIQHPPGFSDFGSLETGDRSKQKQAKEDEEDVTCQGTEIDDEDEELDSLDDGLHAFHPPFSLDQSGGAVLPNHDGMGSFPALYHNNNNDNVQEHLWQFERYNPSNRRRAQRRRSSVQRKFDALEEQETDKQEEKRLRIETWRLEQSRAVLEEIEKETRRRRRELSIVSRTNSTAAPSTETESFWQRVTRRVIKDLMGLDDTTLSVIFGEELAPAAQTTPTQQSPLTEVFSAHQDRVWENRLLNRIAKELGILANQLADYDRQDRTFSTYTPYQPDRPTQSQPRQIPPPSTTAKSVDVPESNFAPPLFAPTFANPAISPAVEADTSLWGIPEQPQESAEEDETSQDKDKDQDTEYWERDLDIGVNPNHRNRQLLVSYPPPGHLPPQTPQHPPSAHPQSLAEEPISYAAITR
ncbi:hypothetical protein E4T38_01503 [Aureobasidium subglaciale]|nr:hypothetical protein E4T38_01503 [Aureobasidium subglaciale]KAI5229791.1 hypothetical protein E4T40_01504 [Aureobasidium subglaciale]KAI5233320.1 hypothetical protein E4T41_01501 [Aureobasidium subglaciale]KAI5266573.1 hypothetical protein E4T46_01503 [Aureobasidium subglaciale]